MSKPIRLAFEPELPFSRRPFCARVLTVPDLDSLGRVRWVPRKKLFVFEPSTNTSLDASCMSAISGYLSDLSSSRPRG